MQCTPGANSYFLNMHSHTSRSTLLRASWAPLACLAGTPRALLRALKHQHPASPAFSPWPSPAPASSRPPPGQCAPRTTRTCGARRRGGAPAAAARACRQGTRRAVWGRRCRTGRGTPRGRARAGTSGPSRHRAAAWGSARGRAGRSAHAPMPLTSLPPPLPPTSGWPRQCHHRRSVRGPKAAGVQHTRRSRGPPSARRAARPRTSSS